MITKNIDFINRMCFKTVKLRSGNFLKSEFNISNEADRLFNRVLDKLSDNDFRILRRFEGRSKITTYLAAIVGRTAIDMIRERVGREREPGKNARPPATNGTIVREGIYSGESGNYLVPDMENIPELKVLKSDSDEKMRSIIEEMMFALTGEEKLLLRMKFPENSIGKPLSTDEISEILGTSKKGVYNRIDRLLKKCRNILLERGISFEDFFSTEKSVNVRHIERRR
jgi:RNA polymerase sigma factor (sigma-70 family)